MNTEGADRTADRPVPVELLGDAGDGAGDRFSSGLWPSLHRPPAPGPVTGSGDEESS